MKCSQKISIERKDREINKQSFNIFDESCLIIKIDDFIFDESIIDNIFKSFNELIFKNSFECFFDFDY